MHKKYKLSVFIFRRDLRLEDNTGLIAALENSEQVIPCFILDPNQITNKNAYKSENSLQFMFDSLHDLNNQLDHKNAKLYLFHGQPQDVLKNIIKELPIDALFVNRDYTPYSKDRDDAIQNLCEDLDIAFESYSDLLLNEPENIKTKQGKPYTVYTAFLHTCSKIPVSKPQKNKSDNYYTKKIKTAVSDKIFIDILPEKNAAINVTGGRKNGLAILKNIADFADYPEQRNILTYKTTMLGAHNKFGTCSIREVYHAIADTFSQEHTLINELYWRDFFTHVAWNFPYVFGNAFHPKFDKLPWSHDTKEFKAWCDGETGFPVVDAAMRQLNTTGFMHNRARMIVGSFLTKDLHIDWQLGEKYFAQKLVDYDPSVNNGNWQWVASTGCDAQPYFRIFNPWLQQKKFDPDCSYIKEWIPELRSVDPKIIHTWYNETKPINKYPLPIVDHAKESKLALSYYKKVGI